MFNVIVMPSNENLGFWKKHAVVISPINIIYAVVELTDAQFSHLLMILEYNKYRKISQMGSTLCDKLKLMGYQDALIFTRCEPNRFEVILMDLINNVR